MVDTVKRKTKITSDSSQDEHERLTASCIPFFILGLFLPIDYVAFIPAATFDFVRYGAAFVIIFMAYSRPKQQVSAPLLGLAAFLLVSSGLISIFKVAILGGGLFAPIVTFVSPLIAYLIARTHWNQRWILLGFVIGSVLSATDILLQASGMPYLGMPSQHGFRYSGFSFLSTAAAPLFAVAICIALMPWAWKKRYLTLRAIFIGILLTALFLSQGRVGVAGLLCAMAILIFVYLLRKPGITSLLTFSSLIAILSSGAGLALYNFINRVEGTGTSDFTSGRNSLNSAAWEAFWSSGLLGVNPDERSIYSPHIAPLTAAVNIGPFGLVATSIVCILLLVIVLIAHQDVPVLFRMIAGIALIVSFIEPSGFFVGFNRVMLVMICFSQFNRTLFSSNNLEACRGKDRGPDSRLMDVMPRV